MKDWMRLNRAHIWYGIPGGLDDHLVSLKSGDPALPFGVDAYLSHNISNWIIENNIKIESRVSYLEPDTTYSNFLSIRFDDPADRLMFIMRFEE